MPIFKFNLFQSFQKQDLKKEDKRDLEEEKLERFSSLYVKFYFGFNNFNRGPN